MKCPICSRFHMDDKSDWCLHCGFKIKNRVSQEELDENLDEKTAHDYFEWLRSLLAFLPYLRQKPEVVRFGEIKYTEDGDMIVPYHIYCEEFEAIEKRFWSGGKWTLFPYYNEIIKKRRINLPITPRSRKIKKVDMAGLLAVFVWSFYGERFCTAFMAGNVEDGTYVILLERLKELLEGLGIDTNVESAIPNIS